MTGSNSQLLVAAQASDAEPFSAAFSSWLVCALEAVEYASRTNSRSMDDSSFTKSSKACPQNSSLCLNREGIPCKRFSRCFSALTSPDSATGMVATSCPDIIRMCNIATEGWIEHLRDSRHLLQCEKLARSLAQFLAASRH